MAKAHEEASAVASILRLLADEVDEQTYMALLNAGTRLLIMMEVPQSGSGDEAQKRASRESGEFA